MSNCDHITELMSAALDGSLTEEERNELDAHLLACSDCAALYSDLQKIQWLFCDPTEQAPEGFTERVMEAVRGESVKDAPAMRRKRRQGKWMPYLAGAAVLAVVLLGYRGVTLLSDGTLNTADSADSGAEVGYSGDGTVLYSESDAEEDDSDLPERAGAAEKSSPEADAERNEILMESGTEEDGQSEEDSYNMGISSLQGDPAAGQIWYARLELTGAVPDELDGYDYTADGTDRYYTVSAEELDRLEGQLTALGYSLTVVREGDGIDQTAQEGQIVIYSAED